MVLLGGVVFLVDHSKDAIERGKDFVIRPCPFRRLVRPILSGVAIRLDSLFKLGDFGIDPRIKVACRALPRRSVNRIMGLGKSGFQRRHREYQ